MDDELIARGFWGPRPESPEAVADALLAFLAVLDDTVGERLRWSSYALPDRSITEPGIAVELITDAFRKNTDAPHLGIHQTYDAHGTRVGEAEISMAVGGWSDSPRFHNAFLVTWRGAEPAALADPILRRLVATWDPDWAAVTSDPLMCALDDLQPRGRPGPKVGYLTYLSEGRARAMPADRAGHLQRLENGGGVLGASEGDGLLPEDELRDLVTDRRLEAALGPTPTTRSKF